MSEPAGLERYYRFHSRIYDATRWSFLFGRTALIEGVATLAASTTDILEIGCGTGRNLVPLCRRFPAARITGVDLSGAMLERARTNLGPQLSRVTLLEQTYDRPLGAEPSFDLIVFSYCLSMINPGWDRAIEHAGTDLRPGGRIAVVDFHESDFAAFKRWMGLNHVRMDSHLLPLLRERFRPEVDEVRNAYGGLWRYFSFVGAKTG
jgi:S-adenosylmethionine-diacylgycerolhomoserine-N-methlytransferase